MSLSLCLFLAILTDPVFIQLLPFECCSCLSLFFALHFGFLSYALFIVLVDLG